MSDRPDEAILFLLCQCGVRFRGTPDVLVALVQKHARDAHNMEASREDVLARARPES
jgi:predicted small metal-binding protein